MIDLSNLRRAASMLDRDLRWAWAGLAAMSLLAAALEAVGTLGVFWLIGLVHSPQTASHLPIVGPLAVNLGFDGSDRWLIGCAVGVMVFYALKNAFLIFHYYLQLKLPQTAFVRVSTALLRGYLTADYAFHFDRNSTEVVRNMISSTDVVFRTVLMNAMTLVSELMMIVAVLAVILTASPTNAVLVAGFLGILAWAMLRMTQSRVSVWGRETQALAKEALKVINQAMGAVKEVKVLHRESYFVRQYHALRQRQSQVICNYDLFQSIPLYLMEALFALLLGGLIIAIALGPQAQASAVPLLGLYGYAGIRLLPALARITAKLQRLSFGSAAVNDVYADYVQLAKASAAPAADVEPLPFRREIELVDISFSYPRSHRPALHQVSFAIPSGGSVGIVGPSGGGKSTLIDILLGLLAPDCGRVLVDGVDTAGAVRAWQRNLGYVPQSSYLLDDTLRRNIAFGLADDEVDEQALADAVRMAQMSEFVESLPNGLNTTIGERGIRLSGGQRQRIVIARALYQRPQVLVFDEATSELDNLTELEIGAAIDTLAGQKTVVIIAHRMTTVRNCDRIVFLVDGRVADIGSYEELLARNPEFSKLTLADGPRAA